MNYLLPLTVTAERLRASLPATLPVRTAVDLAQVKDQAIGSPEVWVIFHRDDVKDAAGTTTLVQFQVAVIYLAPGVLPDLERDGEALTGITKAVAGFQPPRSTGLGPFKRIGSMVPQTWSDASLVAYGMLVATSGTL
jgi:hypothetical protein